MRLNANSDSWSSNNNTFVGLQTFFKVPIWCFWFCFCMISSMVAKILTLRYAMDALCIETFKIKLFQFSLMTFTSLEQEKCREVFCLFLVTQKFNTGSLKLRIVYCRQCDSDISITFTHKQSLIIEHSRISVFIYKLCLASSLQGSFHLNFLIAFWKKYH